MPFRLVLRIIEGYPVQVPFKGGFVTFRPKVVFYTSDCHPNGWCFIKDTVSRQRGLLSPVEQEQFYRRVTRIYHLRRPRAFAQQAEVLDHVAPPPLQVLNAQDFFNNL